MSRAARVAWSSALLATSLAASAAAGPGERVLRTPQYRDLQKRLARDWNTFVYLGFRNYELPEARADLGRRSYELLMKSWRKDGAIYERTTTR